MSTIEWFHCIFLLLHRFGHRMQEGLPFQSVFLICKKTFYRKVDTWSQDRVFWDVLSSRVFQNLTLSKLLYKLGALYDVLCSFQQPSYSHLSLLNVLRWCVVEETICTNTIDCISNKCMMPFSMITSPTQHVRNNSKIQWCPNISIKYCKIINYDCILSTKESTMLNSLPVTYQFSLAYPNKQQYVVYN